MVHIDIFPGVYEPAEDTYLLLEVLKKVVKPGDRVLEVGTGSGLIALTLASMGADVHASDIDPVACRCARENARANGVDVQIIQGDLFHGIKGKFDILAYNPPYLPIERDGADRPAWSGGKKGCEVAVRFLRSAKKHLSKGGRGYLLFSSLGGEEEIYKVLRSHYKWEKVADQGFDFETIVVVEFKAQDD
jgi:release factor glutamine methyltransferase